MVADLPELTAQLVASLDALCAADPKLLADGDAELLEDLVLAAVRDAVVRATALSDKAMGGVGLGQLGGGLLG